MPELNILIAFTAGVIAFLSPCVLPIVPGYLSYISGMSVQGNKEGIKWHILLASFLFVLGFSLVFTALGASASFVGQLLRSYQDYINKVGGAVVVFFGLHFAGVFLRKNFLKEYTVVSVFLLVLSIGLHYLGYLSRSALVGIVLSLLLVLVLYQLGFHKALYKQMKIEGSVKFGLISAFLMGVFFAFGWSPCIGPVLGAILLYASQQETVLQGATLLFAFSIGMGVPFLLAGAFISVFLSFVKGFGKYFGYVELVGGVMLVVLGILLATGELARITTILGTWGL